ncbi:MAG: hypothetical protein M3209_09575 [Acidobacteriota bacterium]|nr:hypothetical protein [Acidobacteriota bacterium]
MKRFLKIKCSDGAMFVDIAEINAVYIDDDKHVSVNVKSGESFHTDLEDEGQKLLAWAESQSESLAEKIPVPNYSMGDWR